MSKFEAFWKSLGYNKVTSDYGMRVDPFTKKQSFHQGIDVVIADKHPLPAVASGEVIFSGETEAGTGLGGLGNAVVMKDEQGCCHIYAHLNSVSVKKGDKIAKGDIVGTQGNTGRSAGSHLHFEIRKTYKPTKEGGYGWLEDRKAATLDPSEYLMKASGTPAPKAEAKPAAKVATKPSGKTYKIASGDTLSEIAKAHKTTVDAIMKLNPTIKDASKIRAGQTINVG